MESFDKLEVNAMLKALLGTKDDKISSLVNQITSSYSEKKVLKEDNIKIIAMDPKQCVVIVGMHRSGTSSIAGILNFCGFYTGEENELIKPDNDNPKGLLITSLL